MAHSPHRRRRWLFPMAVAAMLAISWWAFKRMPTPTLVGHERVASGVTVTSSSSTPSADWTIHLRLDPSMKPPGQGWILHEGKQVGDGYELHWLPEKLGLQILRAPDHLLLGTSRLSRMPRTVEFVRRGPWLMVRCDAKLVLTCLDPLGAPQRDEAAASGGYQAWGCTPVGSMGDTAITVEDDRDQSDADIAADIPSEDDPREHDAVALVRQVLMTDPTKASARDIEAVFGAAAQALSQLPAGSAPHLRLRHWLALGEIQLALARPDDFEGAERASDAVDQLAMLCASEPVPEAAGILMSLFPRLAYNACFRPSYPDPPAHVLGNRSMWMRVLGAAAVAAHANASPAIGDDLQFQLRLLIHACGCLQTPAVKSLKSAADAARDAQPQPSP
ncbi:MAG: hypothetical protein H0W83_16950, partial [Planctomycetes bacterium]|nr:hypothetical protein [Planctomycetota bacterium]